MATFTLLLILAGAVGGLLAGMLGIGGGVFFVLVLPAALTASGVPIEALPAYVISNSLFGTFFSGLSSALAHRRRAAKAGTRLPVKESLLVGIPALFAASISLPLVVRQPWFSPRVFTGIVLVLLAALATRTLIAAFLPRTQGPERPLASTTLGTIGVGAGLVASVSGLGGGILVVPMLSWLGRYKGPHVGYVSNGAVVLSSLASLVTSLWHAPAHALPWSLGYILLPVAGPLALGVVVAAPFGVKLSRKLAPRTAALLYVAFVALVMARKVWELSAA